MTTKISKEELRKRDQVMEALRKAFDWSLKNVKAIFAVLIVFVVAGLGYSLTSHFKQEAEVEVQEKYFKLEEQVVDKKQKFAEATRLLEAAKTDKKAPAPASAPATGDLEKDYGQLVTDLEGLVKEASSFAGGQMAALLLSDLYMEHSAPEKALAVVDMVESHAKKDGLLTALIYTQKGNALAEMDKCTEAITAWTKITGNKALQFAHNEAKLRMALCHESLGQTEQAESLYSEVAQGSTDEADYSASRDAQKYLRLLKAKKNQQAQGT